ncbi:Peptidase S8, subtilisin-related [Fusarium oxysporum f. sp. vasinfectum]|nr:Peptidase S8, subtilisin-related [Fusarium oxysporum f. sp. vasinfectum]
MVRLSIVAALYAVVVSAVDFDKIAVGKGHSRLPGAYIFEFEENHDCADFFAKASSRGKTRMQYNYKLFKGASIQFTDIDNAEDLASEMALLPGIKQKWPVQTFSIPKPEIHWTGTPGMEYKSIQKRGFEERDAANDTFSPHVMTQIDKLRAEGVTGKGLKVALVDSGIDYKHPALGGCFGKNCLVSFGTDLVGDAYDGSNHAKPDNDPMDCAGHGTHVAGILAAQKNTMGFTGAAPGVQIGAYRAFGCNGEAGNDVLIAAFNQAFEDGADIISASIGGPSGWSEEPWAVAVSRIVEQGVPCVLAAGECRGYGNVFMRSLALLNASKYSIDGGPEHEFGHLSGKPSAWKGVKLPLWALNYDTSVADDGCDEWPKNTPDLGNYIVLLRRGSCTFDAKAANAVKAGAKYIMFYSNKEDLAPFDVSSVGGIKAASIVSPEQGAEWIASLKAKKKITLSMSDGSDGNVILEQKHNNITAGAASTFSSWGPTWEMDVKPQFGAPGGTSMASPLVAGIVALIAEARGTRDPALIEDLLSASANPQLFNDGKTFYDFLAPVPQQGGGIVQAHDAAHAKVLLSRSSLSFNDTDHFVESLNFTVKNTGKKQIDLQISHVPAVTMFTLVENYIYPDEFPNDFAKEHASLKFSESKFTIDAGESIVIEVLATPPKGLNATRSLHDSMVLGPKDTWIANSTDENRFPVPDNTTWTLPKPGTANNLTDTLPGLTWFLALGSAKLHAEIMPVTTEKPTSSKKPRVIGEPIDFPLLWNAMGANSQAFTGELADGTFAPAGQYVVRYRALRIFGNEKKKEDWDEAYSPVFTIRYEK